MTAKIHTLTDAQGRPLRFILTGGEVHDSTTAAALLTGRATAGVIADKAYDNNALREFIADAGAAPIIPSLRSRKILIPHDAVAYKLRNRIERLHPRMPGARRSFATGPGRPPGNPPDPSAAGKPLKRRKALGYPTPTPQRRKPRPMGFLVQSLFDPSPYDGLHGGRSRKFLLL